MAKMRHKCFTITKQPTNNKTMTKKTKYTVLGLIAAPLVVVCGGLLFLLYSSMASGNEAQYVYIDNDDTIDSVYAKIEPYSKGYSMDVFKKVAGVLGYEKNIRTGRYAIEPGNGALTNVRRFRNGQQTPVALAVPSVRTIKRLSEEVSKRLLMDGDELYAALTNPEVCKKYGLDTLNIQCLFIPNTYDIYWNISVEKFLDRMKKESDNFWTAERQQKAKEAGMTKQQVVTLASIVDEETANDGEKPMIAGLYINRLKSGTPLQADPTVKYALQQFALKRIYNDMLKTDSPYNTYRNTGLPPGPIRIPSVAGIDAVLNHVHHDYMYMCAKEDFSGTHNFAVTYKEHLANAARYTEALNKRGIK